MMTPLKLQQQFAQHRKGVDWAMANRQPNEIF
jgi:hypothetical protein